MANTYGLNFIKIGGIWILQGGRNPLLGGGTFDLWCPFSNSDGLFQSKFMCENLVWIGWNWRYVNFQVGGRSPLLGGVTCALQCLFSNLSELFQSKVMFENLVRIGWAIQELLCSQTKKKNNWIFRGAEIPCWGEGASFPFDAHFRTRMSYSS